MVLAPSVGEFISQSVDMGVQHIFISVVRLLPDGMIELFF